VPEPPHISYCNQQWDFTVLSNESVYSFLKSSYFPFHTGETPDRVTGPADLTFIFNYGNTTYANVSRTISTRMRVAGTIIGQFAGLKSR
jgi:hypothetical protein